MSQNQHYFTIAELTAKEGKFEELVQVLTDLAAATRQEVGAKEYFFIKDVNKPNTILSYERWENDQEELKHWSTPHLEHAFTKLPQLLEGDAVVHKGHQII
jgi:quinol monooxygenase YgiN